MCRPVNCKTCGKTTWAGCGSHVAEVRRSVPAQQWCGGHDKAETSASSGGGLWSRLRSKS